MAKITILSGNSDGTLNLSDGGHTRAVGNESIKWDIDSNSNVASISSIRAVRDPDDIFSVRPQRDDVETTKWKAKIKGNARVHAQCKYAIDWVGKQDGNVPGSHTHDPLISIKPSATRDIVVMFAVVVVTAIMAIFALEFFRKKKR